MLLTRPPLGTVPKDHTPSDLHVLGTPPAFVLSQDQTRHPIHSRSLLQGHDLVQSLIRHLQVELPVRGSRL